ncbi:MAG: hypothetical protein IJ457_06580 [Clostridia bacterium]|nr:hypothetical protein [Clostridia bacterium]
MEVILELLCTAYEAVLSRLSVGIRGRSPKTETVIKHVIKAAMWVLFALLFAGIILVGTEYRFIGGVLLATVAILLFTQLILCALFYKKR